MLSCYRRDDALPRALCGQGGADKMMPLLPRFDAITPGELLATAFRRKQVRRKSLAGAAFSVARRLVLRVLQRYMPISILRPNARCSSRKARKASRAMGARVTHDDSRRAFTLVAIDTRKQLQLSLLRAR